MRMNTFTNDKFARSNFFAAHIFAAMLAPIIPTMKGLITEALIIALMMNNWSEFALKLDTLFLGFSFFRA